MQLLKVKEKIGRYLSVKFFLIKSYLVGNRRIYLDKNVFLPFTSQIIPETHIGFGTGITGKLLIKGFSKVYIGKYCTIGANVKIITSNHKIDTINLNITLDQKFFNQDLHDTSKGETIIGSNVWIGDSVIILPGVNIGHGAIIGAGAIVTKSVPPFAIYAGNPARLIRTRFPEDIIKQLLEIKWWDWSEDKIKRNKKFFKLDLAKTKKINFKNIIVK